MLGSTIYTVIFFLSTGWSLGTRTLLHRPWGLPANSSMLVLILMERCIYEFNGESRVSGWTRCKPVIAKRHGARQNVFHRSGFLDTWDYWFSYHWSTWFNREGITVTDAHTETLITPGQDVIIQFNSIQFSLFTN